MRDKTERLDLKGVKCPLNFVKTKLKLEQMQRGELLEIVLDDRQALNDVPRSLKEEGHRVLGLREIEGSFLLVIKKA